MDKRQAIIFTGAKLIHEKGYHHVGIKAILDELQIPKGSFYHYFKSKEDLGMAIIDIYLMDTQEAIASVSHSLEGLKNFFNIFFDRLRGMSMKCGCPVGNLILELSDENESFRMKLHDWYELVYKWIDSILSDNGYEDATRRAKALFAAFEGAMMAAKLDKSDEHFDIFYEITLSGILMK